MTLKPWKDYLGPTLFCDRDDARVKECSCGISRHCRTEQEKAQAVFSFVRDEIAYRFDYPWRRASETLLRRSGNCFNKANLQIALLRALGVEAGYAVCLITKEVFRPILPPEIFEMVSDPTIHVYCAVNISGRWTSCDATIDQRLFDAVYSSREHWRHDRWDATTDLRLDPVFVVEEQGVYANIDLCLGSPVKFWTDELLAKANGYLDFLTQPSGKGTR